MLVTGNRKLEEKWRIPMRYIDLHVHSCYSDGSFTPAELVEMAADAGLSAFALTDHDTLAGLPEALAAAEAHNKTKNALPLEVIPGVEISAAFRDRDIHILGLLVDPGCEELTNALSRARIERDSRNQRMVDRLNAAGVPIDLNAIEEANPGSVITRAHLARYLVEQGIVSEYKAAFDKYLGDHTPYYIARKFIEPEDAIRLILAAGGVPVLAHPLLYHLNERELRELLTRLTGYGLVGIETLYSANSAADETFVRRLANEFDLLMTGGSDFHGAPKPSIRIGSGLYRPDIKKGNLAIPYELLEKLRIWKAKHPAD